MLGLGTSPLCCKHHLHHGFRHKHYQTRLKSSIAVPALGWSRLVFVRGMISQQHGVFFYFYTHTFIQPLLLKGQFSSSAVCSWEHHPFQHTLGSPGASEAAATAGRWVKAGGPSGCTHAREPGSEHSHPTAHSGVPVLPTVWEEERLRGM